MALLLYDISKRLGVTVVIFAAIKGAEQVFVIWGKGVAEAMAAAGMNAGAQDAVIAVAVVAMMLAATLILLSEKELASRWGVRILDAGGLVEKTPEELRRDERRPSWPSTPASPRGKPRFWRWWPRARTARHHAGAVHRRGHLQGPHEPHLREVRRREPPRARGAFGRVT